MAGEVPKTVSLKLFVDKENKRVIFAEADSDFVDVLFSFLTLPVGTVIRILSKQSQELELGCMHNLYKSVENLEGKHFLDDMCKKMLLHTRNSSADMCRELKVNIDDTDHDHVSEGLLSTFCYGRCGCGGKLTKKMPLTEPNATVDQEDGVFLKARWSYMITDDLRVMPLSAESILGLLNSLGAGAIEAFEERAINVTQKEVSRLLKHMLLNDASLTGTFLREQGHVICKPKFQETHKDSPTKKKESDELLRINLNVIVQKSEQRIICAEAGDDFVNFLMSLLTFPLGAILKVFDGLPFIGSISNLYKSVEGLSVDKYVKSEHHKEMLLSPKLALQYACKYQLLDVAEATSPSFFFNYNSSRNCPVTLSATKLYPGDSSCQRYSRALNLVKMEGFVSGSTTFMITDDLVVTPFSSISTINMLKQLKVPMDDVEQQVLSIGRIEALQMLGAAMISNTALTDTFRSITRKNMKQESVQCITLIKALLKLGEYRKGNEAGRGVVEIKDEKKPISKFNEDD